MRPAPSGWEIRHSSSKNRDYYFNPQTGESQWEFPEVAAKDSVRVLHLLVKHSGSRRPSSWKQVPLFTHILAKYNEKRG